MPIYFIITLNKKMTKQVKSIKLLTYNVFLRPPPIKTNEDDYKNQRLDDILECIKNYDVICFQQMFQTASFRKQKVIEAAIMAGFLYWKDCEAPSFWSGPPVDSGLLVISKYPILYSKFQSFNVGVLSDSASDKGYIYCKIQVNGKILHLFTTHLQASYLNPDMMQERQLSIKTRLYQFKTLLQKIKEILAVTRQKPSQQLVLLMGDLNMNALMIPMTLHGNVLENEKVGKQFIEYQSFMKIFKEAGFQAKNCGLERYKKHPITFGDGDTILTDRLQSLSKQCLDFIFQLDVSTKLRASIENPQLVSPVLKPKKKIETVSSKQFLLMQNQSKKLLKPILSSTKVEQFKVKDRPYGQLSDHYGMSIEVSIQ